MEMNVRTGIGVDRREPGNALFERAAFDVPNVHCWTCAFNLEETLRTLPGVRSAMVRPLTGSVEVTFDPTVTSAEELRHGLRNGGFLTETSSA